MTPLRQRMIEDMQLRGLAPQTQKAYVNAVRRLAGHYGKSPAVISEEELRQYFLYLTNEKEASQRFRKHYLAQFLKSCHYKATFYDPRCL